MNRRFLTMAVILVVTTTLLGGFVFLNQWRQEKALSIVPLQKNSSPTPASSDPTPNMRVTPVGSELSLDETRELMQLRNELRALRVQQKELPALQQQVQRLTQRLSETNNPASGAAFGLSPQYRRADSWKAAGNATPEAALETFLFALRTGDSNLLRQVVGPEDISAIAAPLDSDDAKMMRQLPGFQIVSNRTDGATAYLQVLFQPAELSSAPVNAAHIRLVATNGLWRVKER